MAELDPAVSPGGAVLVCDHCGARNGAAEEFCVSCGRYLDWAAAEPLPARRARELPRSEVHEEASPGPGELLEDTLPGRRAPAARHEQPAEDEADGSGRSVGQPAVEGSRGSAYDSLFRSQGDGVADGERPAADGATRAAVATTVLPALPSPPSLAPPSPVLLKASQHGPCPVCSRVNDGHLRFCAKCGHALVVTTSGGSRLRPRTLSRWRRLVDSHERAARREYRRSLPPFYRWRRTVIGAVVVCLVGSFLLAAGTNPRRVVLSGWHDLRQSVVNVDDVQVEVLPSSATTGGTSPTALVDRTEEAWTATWRPKQPGHACVAAPGTVTVELRFAPRRIRQIVFRPGLPDTSAERVRQSRPKVVAVMAAGRCQAVTLLDTSARQPFTFDSGIDTASVVVGVVSTYPPAANGHDEISFTEIVLKTRPQA